MKYLFICLLFMSIFTARGQAIISSEKAAKHIGETVKIIDKVFSSTVQKDFVLLKVGRYSVHSGLAVLIKLSDHNLNDKEHAKYTGQDIYVTGKLTQYRGMPTIVVTNLNQIRLVMVDRDLRTSFD